MINKASGGKRAALESRGTPVEVVHQTGERDSGVREAHEHAGIHVRAEAFFDAVAVK